MLSTTDRKPEHVMVFHAGALGDTVLIWPLLRAIVRGGRRATLVCGREKGLLTRRWLGAELGVIDSEQRWVSRLWAEQASDPDRACRESADLVVSFLLGDRDASMEEGAARWTANVRRAVSAREVLFAGQPGCDSRAAVWRRFGVESLGGVAPRRTGGGHVVLHVGAGASSKRWVMERWGALAHRVRAGGSEARVIAGEVEAEKLSPDELRAFEHMGGTIVASLGDLGEIISTARAFVGADTGPTHLAAQLGVPTIALFGPTDVRVWSPIGPSVSVVSPDRPSAMAWLDVERAWRALERSVFPSR